MFAVAGFAHVALLDIPHPSTAAVDDLVQRPVTESFFEVEPERGEDLIQPRPPVFDVFADAPEITYLLDIFEVEPERGEEYIEPKNINDSFNIIGVEIAAILDFYEVEELGLEAFDPRGVTDDSFDS